MAAAAADSSMQGPSPIPAAWAETKPTDEQWDELMARCKEKAPVLLAAAQSEENLKSIGHKNGVDMWTAKTEESKVFLVRGTTQVRASDTLLKRSLISSTHARFCHVFHAVDPMFEDGRVLDFRPRDHHFPDLPFYAVKWARYSLPTGGILWDRDVVFVEYADEVAREDGLKLGFGVAVSANLPQYGDLEDQRLCRADLLLSGYVFRELEPGLCELTYIVQCDVKGILPAWAVNLGARDQALNVGRMRDWLEGLEQAQQRMEAKLSPLVGTPVITDITVGRRSEHRHALRVHDGHEVHWHFCVREADVQFHIESEDKGHNHGHDTPSRFDAQAEPVGGVFQPAGAAEIAFVWDNTYSWFKSKQIFFIAEAVPVGREVPITGGDDGPEEIAPESADQAADGGEAAPSSKHVDDV